MKQVTREQINEVVHLVKQLEKLTAKKISFKEAIVPQEEKIARSIVNAFRKAGGKFGLFSVQDIETGVNEDGERYFQIASRGKIIAPPVKKIPFGDKVITYRIKGQIPFSWESQRKNKLGITEVLFFIE